MAAKMKIAMSIPGLGLRCSLSRFRSRMMISLVPSLHYASQWIIISLFCASIANNFTVAFGQDASFLNKAESVSSSVEKNITEEASVFADQPIQIVKPDEDHKKLVLLKENLKYMQSITGPVAMVAVVGKFHSGKSFLMNQLMGKTNGFGIGPSVRPETMGIWIWGKPLVMQLANGQEVSVIFLDTEGFAANNVSENYDAKIFAVATLLSSHLLFNSVKIIDQVDIDYLELLARRTQLFALRSQMNKHKWSGNFNHNLLSFPPLTWVVQDFVQTTDEDPKQWLHRLMDTHTRENEDYEIGLLGIFKSVDCHTLFLPAVSKKLLSDLSKVTEADLTPEYRVERNSLMEKLRREIVPKEKENVPLNGAELAALLELLVKSANEGSLAEVPSRWDGFIQKLEQTAVEDCKMFYESELSILQEKFQNGPIQEKALRKWHVQTLKKSTHLLDQLLHGLDEAHTNGQKKLQGDILVIYEKFRDLNDKRLKLRCSELQHQIELRAEEMLHSLSLPVTSPVLKMHINSTLDKSIQMLKDELVSLVEEDTQTKYLSFLKKTLLVLASALELENNKALETFLNQAINTSLAKFKVLTTNDDQIPHKPQVLKNIIKEAKTDARKEFEDKCKKFANEVAYKPYLAMLESQLSMLANKVEEDNMAFVNTYISGIVEGLISNFEEAIGDAHLSLPMNYSDIENRLKIEQERTAREYEVILEEYKVYSSYNTWDRKLKNEISRLSEQRKHENTKAFAEEVKKPLARAKEIVLLSSDKFSTTFSLRKYIREVCLLQLDEGKAQFWSLDVKENVIEHFIGEDYELAKALEEKHSFLSSIIGFFEWLFWILGIIK